MEHGEDDQKRLAIIFSASPLGKQAERPTVGFWLLNKEDARDWLAPRRAMFPGASGQELVSLSLMPQDLRTALAALLCGLAEGDPAADEKFCGPPQFDKLTETSAACHIFAHTMGSGAKGRRSAALALTRFEGHMAAAMPQAMRLDAERLRAAVGSGEDGADAEASMLAQWEQAKLGLGRTMAAPGCSAGAKPRL